MHPNNLTSNKTLVPQPELCKMLGLTRSGLDKLKKKDTTFPKPIKFGDTRQAAAYYVVTEVNAWLRSKVEARDAVTTGKIA